MTDFMKTIKIGDRFVLLGMEWEVEIAGSLDFKSRPANTVECGTLWLSNKDADSLDWIKEPATISKEARDEIVEWAKGKMMSIGGHAELKDYLDSMVRDGE